MRVRNREQQGKDEKGHSEPNGELRKDMRCLSAEDVVRHAATKGCAETFATWKLHENNQHQQEADTNVHGK
jgi:hypothetical protein